MKNLCVFMVPEKFDFSVLVKLYNEKCLYSPSLEVFQRPVDVVLRNVV